MPLPTDPEARRKIAAVMVRLGKLPPKERADQVQRIKEVRQDRLKAQASKKA